MILETKIIFGDVSAKWIALAKAAKERLIIFTPYFDDKLIEVIDSIEDPMTFEKVTLVTNMDDEHIAQNMHQIRTLKTISDKGVLIKGLSNLHAKVLVVDEKYTTIGSQNFTRRGSNTNEEATVVLTMAVDEDEYYYFTHFDDVKRWLDKSKTVTPEWIQKLSELFPEGERIKDEALQESLLKIKTARIEIRKEKYKHSTTIIAQCTGVVKTYKDDREYNSKNWKLVIKDGYALKKFKGMMLPIINYGNELRFVRVGSTQFSRFSNSVQYSKSFSIKFGDKKIGNKYYNIHVEVKSSIGSKLADSYLNFDGIDFEDFHVLYAVDNDNIRAAADTVIWGKGQKDFLDEVHDVPKNIIDVVLKSFWFSKPLNYTSNDTSDFLSEEGTYKIVLRKFEDRLFFTIERTD